MPGRYVSDQNYVTLIHESGTYANPSGVDWWPGQVTGNAIAQEENIERLRYSNQGTRDPGDQVNVMRDVAGTLTLRPQGGRFLYFALGSSADTSGTTSTHILTNINNDESSAQWNQPDNGLPTFALRDLRNIGRAGSNFGRLIKGCMVDTLTLTAEQGNFVTMDVAYQAQSAEFISGLPVGISGTETVRPFRSADASFHLPSGTKIDSTKTQVLNIGNTLEKRHYNNGSLEAYVPKPTARDINVDITMDMNATDSKAIYDQYYSDGS